MFLRALCEPAPNIDPTDSKSIKHLGLIGVSLDGSRNRNRGAAGIGQQSWNLVVTDCGDAVALIGCSGQRSHRCHSPRKLCGRMQGNPTRPSLCRWKSSAVSPLIDEVCETPKSRAGVVHRHCRVVRQFDYPICINNKTFLRTFKQSVRELRLRTIQPLDR